MTEKTKSAEGGNSPFVEDMAKAGAHLGHKVSEIHPKMKPYLCGVRNGVHIIDLEKTEEKLQEACRFLESLIQSKKVVLFVATKVQLRDIVRDVASATGMPSMTHRWLGGTFTNFETMKKRLEYFQELEQAMKSEDIQKYTKLERLRKEEELQELDMKFSGIRTLEGLPDAVFVVDVKEEMTAIREARSKGIPVIAVVDTNTDPSLVDYPIPSNDDTVAAVALLLAEVQKAIQEAQKNVPKEQAE